MFGLKKLSAGGAGKADPSETASVLHADATAAANAAADGRIRVSIDEAMQLIESDIGNAVGTMTAATGAVKSRVAEKLKLITGIRDDTNSLAERSEEATASATKLATALDALAASSSEIGIQVQQSSEMAAVAETVADEASAGIEELKAALTRIEDVVRVISDVAKQTNLLALNATIEAARAGEAGRGFAVVANEVKGLSSETQKATDEIAGNIQSLQLSAERSIKAVNGIIEQIARIRPVFSAVAAAVEEQVAATGEVGESANTTSAFVREVAERADAIRTATDAAAEVGLEVDRETEAVMKLAAGMNARLVMMMRQTEIGDRRRFDRLPVEIAGRAEAAGRKAAILTVDLSEGGVLFKTREAAELPATGEVRLSLEGIGTLSARIVARSELGWHAAFREHSGEAYEALVARLASVRRENETFIKRGQEAAERIGKLFEAALERREITIERLFDTAYKAIPDTDPQQWSVRSLDFLEGVLPQVQEPLLASDRRMAFCAAVDRNGYLPVHNRIYSQPQRPDDPAWNAANCRNRRIFDDRAGLSAARNLRPFLVQSYPRDMGNGKIVWMKEIDAPIVVGGRHWGGLRTAYRM